MANSSRRFYCRLPAILGLALLCGCGAAPQIATYTIPKETPDRLLGGILFQEDRGWFFKLSGPREEIDSKAEQFRQFLQSISVTSDSLRPTWKLPEGWQLDDTPREMRVATIKVPLKSKSAELTVTVLPRQSGDDNSYLLANINRWRDQLSQSRIASHDLESLEQLNAGDAKIWYISISGRLKAAGMTPPFAGKSGM